MRLNVLNYHERQDLSCPQCHRTFVTKKSLNRHTKYVHKTDELDTIEYPAEGRLWSVASGKRQRRTMITTCILR
jgi:hypothetical protein